MKKRIFFTATLVGMIAFTGCQRFDFDEARNEAIRQNATNIFGEIDPNQDWNSSISGSVTITADAPLYDVVSVQILTESPFLNDDARVVAEAKAQKGQAVTLNYDVLNSYETLVAACVDSKGHYYITPFKVTDSQVSFLGTATTRAARRTAATGVPDASLIKLELNNSEQSYNAKHAINKESGWENSGWENDRLWNISNVADLGNGWKMDLKWSDGKTNSTDYHIYREVDELSATEEAELKAIFNTTLFRRELNEKGQYVKVKNNIDRIRKSTQVTLYNNHLISDGKNAITITPVMMPSTDIRPAQVYYYYFNPDDIPAGMSESEYIQQLPKFKAVECAHASKEAERRGKVVGNMNADNDFFRIYEYILPYFGDVADFMPETVNTSSLSAVADPTIYRIRNKALNQEYYMTYTGNANQMAKKYDDTDANVANQLWQKFTLSDGRVMLYNVGTKSFMQWGNGITILSNIYTNDKYLTFYIKGEYIWKSDNSQVLKLNEKNDGNIYVSPDKNTQNDWRKWIFEEYTGGNIAAVTNVDLTKSSEKETYTAVSTVIPAGYKVGLMLRNTKYPGELYSDGQLNILTNRYIQNFKNALANGMYEDDTRMAIFTANGKTYITFEDGSDTNYSDLILELGGFDTEVVTEEIVSIKNSGTSTSTSLYTSNGVQNSQLYDETEVPGASYMLLFEDRPTSADYDMNDVVLRCQRYHDDPGCVRLSLVAAGGTDNVVIRGIEGTLVKNKGFELNNEEVHELFGVAKATGYDRIVNTMDGKQTIDPCSGVYRIPDGMTIPQFLANIYIENQTTGEVVRVAKTGESPWAIIMPRDFQYPKERQSITAAYQEFLDWARNATGHQDWYNHITEDLVYPLEKIIN
jgi:hypothetical protein